MSSKNVANPASDRPQAPPSNAHPAAAAIEELEAQLNERSIGLDPADIEITPGGRRLGELLLERRLVNTAQIGEALLQQSSSGKRLGALLVELGALDERALAKTLAEQLGLDFVDLRSVAPQPEALEMLPEAVARGIGALPIRRTIENLQIAVADPSDETLAQLGKATGVEVKLMIAAGTDIRRAINNCYRALAGIEAEVELFTASHAPRLSAVSSSATGESAPIVNVVNLIITQGLRDRASDVHVEPQDGRVRVRYRIDGALHDVLALPYDMGAALISRIKIMAAMNIVERRRSQDGQIQMNVDGRPVDIRVSSAATVWGEKAVLRLLDKSRPLFRMSDLGMPAQASTEFSKLVRSPFGMVLVAGPTGSGKTTTLYATLMEINHSERNIMTIEDPVEYIFPSINQMQINEPAGVTFAGGLKSILRQDPDIILVGEIRDVETARIAVQSALTGHFVLSSLHATDAASALHRFLDMGIESFLIASSVIAVVGQRLVRRVCNACKVPYTPSSDEMVFYRQAGGKATKKLWQGEGCNFCSMTGYQDRIGVYEVLRMTDEMKGMIVKNRSYEELRDAAIRNGMVPMPKVALGLISEGVTTISEVMRSIYIL